MESEDECTHERSAETKVIMGVLYLKCSDCGKGMLAGRCAKCNHTAIQTGRSDGYECGKCGTVTPLEKSTQKTLDNLRELGTDLYDLLHGGLLKVKPIDLDLLTGGTGY